MKKRWNISTSFFFIIKKFLLLFRLGLFQFHTFYPQVLAVGGVCSSTFHIKSGGGLSKAILATEILQRPAVMTPSPIYTDVISQKANK